MSMREQEREETMQQQQRPFMTRRQFITAASLGAGAIALTGGGWWLSQQGRSSVPALTRLPTFPRASSTGRIREYSIAAQVLHLPLGGQVVTTWGYQGNIPGPELRLTEGDTLRVTLTNQLPQETTIHWHGVPLINAMDGVPAVTQKAIAPGQQFVYEFVVPTAGTYFYHSHVDLQLDRGLYGPLIVEAAHEPLTYDHDITLLLDDWLDGMPATPDAALTQLLARGDTMGSTVSNSTQATGAAFPPDIVYPLYLINGKSSEQPFTWQMRQGERARLRLINAASATIYHVALQGHRLMVTHTDGQPVEPIKVDTLRLSMGERYDVLVTATEAGAWQFAALAEGTHKMVRAVLRTQGSTTANPPATFLPQELRGQLLTYGMLKADASLPTLPEQGTADQVLPIILSGGMGQYIWGINNQVFPKADQLVVQRDRFIRFPFQNQSMMPHPMHLHGHFFQLANGTGRGPWKDTVLIDPMQQLTVNWLSDNPGLWAFHCHNAYHLATGMMRLVNIG